MSAIIPIASLAVSAIAGLGGAVQSVRAGDAQASELKRRAEQEEIAARDRELQRRVESNKVLAAQIAGQGASGTGGEGSSQALAINDARVASLDTQAAQAQNAALQQQLRSQQQSSRKLGRIRAGTGLLGTFGSLGLAGTQAGLFK